MLSPKTKSSELPVDLGSLALPVGFASSFQPQDWTERPRNPSKMSVDVICAAVGETKTAALHNLGWTHIWHLAVFGHLRQEGEGVRLFRTWLYLLRKHCAPGSEPTTRLATQGSFSISLPNWGSSDSLFPESPSLSLTSPDDRCRIKLEVDFGISGIWNISKTPQVLTLFDQEEAWLMKDL